MAMLTTDDVVKPRLTKKEQRRAYTLLQRISKWDRLAPSQRRAKFGRGYGIYDQEDWRRELRSLVGEDEFSALMARHTRQRVKADQLEPVGADATGITGIYW